MACGKSLTVIGGNAEPVAVEEHAAPSTERLSVGAGIILAVALFLLIVAWGWEASLEDRYIVALSENDYRQAQEFADLMRLAGNLWNLCVIAAVFASALAAFEHVRKS